MANEKLTTPHLRVMTLVAGHFKQLSGYYAYRPRGSDDYLLIYTISGQGRFGTADGRERLALPGDVVLLLPGAYHDYSVGIGHSRWELVWTHFLPRGDWLDLLNWPEDEPGRRWLSVAGHPLQNELLSAFMQVHRQAASTDPLRDRLGMNALESLLLLCERTNPARDSHVADARVRQVMDHVARHFGDRFSLDVLAEVGGMSASRLGHLFGEIVGVSPMVFVEQQRIARARQLLTMTSLSVKEIARQVGYDTQFYFSLRFKKQTGQNPTAYRTAARQAVADGV